MIPTQEDAEELEALFDRTADLDTAGRRERLDVLRASRPDLARELEALLAAHDGGEGFLAEPASLEAAALDELAPTARPAGGADELIGHAFGGFRILRHIGSGGMGHVYEARQDRPRRRAALKVLHEAATSSRVRARFADEAETLARLDHPNVAHVYGAGTADGPRGPFSWMAVERIPDPLPITEYAEREGLDVDGRLRLLLGVCDGVHHAHQKGVLHRDLKPANLLVSASGDGRPKVIDFGLARLLEPLDAAEQERTRSGELLGTLRYMSPEQSAGDTARMDVRTDVYALGVVLYELVTGRLPYDLEGLSLLEILRTIRERAPLAPRGVRPEIGSDLSAILLTALAKEPEGRYDSVAALRDDVARYLAREPVLARDAGWAHRAALFARRHTALFTSLAVGGAVTVVAVSTIVVLYLDKRSVLRELQEASRAAEEQRSLVVEARADLTQLQALLDGLLLEDEDGDADVAASVVRDAVVARDSAQGPEDRRRVVADAVERLRLLAPILETDPRSAAPLAAAFVKVGDLHGAEWNAAPEDAAQSLPAYREGVRLWRRALAGASAEAERARAETELSDALVKLAHGLRKQGREAEAPSYADEAVLLARRALERGPDDPDVLHDLIAALWARGDLYIRMEPFERGLTDSREAERFAERLLALRPDGRRAREALAWSLLRVGLWTGRLEDDGAPRALAAHARALDLYVDLAEDALRAEDRDALRDAAHGVFGVFVWNELPLLFELRGEDDVLARLEELFALGERLVERDVVGVVLPCLDVLAVLVLERTADADAHAAALARLGRLHDALDEEEAERVRREAAEMFEIAEYRHARWVGLAESAVARELLGR